MKTSIHTVSRHRAALGEGPLWDHRCNRLLWCDIHEQMLLVIEDGNELEIPFEGGITSICLAAGGGYIATSERNFLHLANDFTQQWQSEPVEPNEPDNRFNDAKVDPQGRFWAGTMQHEARGRQGRFFRLAGAHHECLIENFGCTNGPAFSPDGGTVYFTDSNAGHIYRGPIDAPLSVDKPFIAFWENEGVPDGMTVDTQGRLYVGHFGGSRISRFLPDGTREATFECPALNITSVAFGGPDMATLFATSAHCTISAAELVNRPDEGATFALDVGARGLPQPEFLPSKEQLA